MNSTRFNHLPTVDCTVLNDTHTLQDESYVLYIDDITEIDYETSDCISSTSSQNDSDSDTGVENLGMYPQYTLNKYIHQRPSTSPTEYDGEFTNYF